VYPYDHIKDLPVRGSSSLRRPDGRLSWEAMAKPEGFNPVGRWMTFTVRQKATIKQLAGQALVATGYCNDLEW
jgi:hypothetical protein